MGLTLIDGLDTAYLMNLSEVVESCKKFIINDLKFDHSGYAV